MAPDWGPYFLCHLCFREFVINKYHYRMEIFGDRDVNSTYIFNWCLASSR